MEAISHAGTVLGVLAKDGVVLAAEKKVTGKLLDLSGARDGGYGGSGEKIYLLNSCVLSVFLIPSCLSLPTADDVVVSLQKRDRRRCGIDGRCEFSRQLCTDGGAAASTHIQ